MNTATLLPNIASLPAATNDNISYIFAQQYNLLKVEENGDVTKYHLEVNGHSYYIGIYVYYILDQIKRGGTLSKIVKVLNNLHSKDVFSPDEVSKVINEDIRQLFVEKEKKPSKVKSLFSIVNPAKVERFISPLKFLYKSSFLKTLFPFVLLLNTAYFIFIRTMVEVTEPSVAYTSMGQSMVYFLCLILCLIFHEIGHAVASLAYGITPKKIGFGIYFIFPAFYTDLTDIWKLGRKERIIINFGGIYFQLIINSLLIAALYLLHPEGVVGYYIQKLILVNIIISIYNVNPFFRFDGYWIFSDYFDIPNLRQESMLFLKKLFLNIKQVFTRTPSTKNLTIEKNYPLWIYSILYIAFMSMIWYFLANFVIDAHSKLFAFLQDFENFNTSSLADWTSLISLLIMSSIPWGIVSVIFYKRYKKKQNLALTA